MDYRDLGHLQPLRGWSVVYLCLNLNVMIDVAESQGPISTLLLNL